MNLDSVLIVGGGIGGLSTALGLAPLCRRVVVVERAEAFAPAGAGIVLAANAVLALRKLGVDVVPHGEILRGFELGRADGLRHSDADPTGAFPEAPTLGIHRAALHDALLAALRAGVEVRLGVAGSPLVDSADGVFLDGERFDLAIAADGLRSSVRAQLGGPEPVYSGYTCWRAVVPFAGLPCAREWWGRGRRFGMVPLPNDRVYWFAVANAPAGAPTPESGLAPLFAGFAEPVQTLLAAADPSTVLHHDLCDLPGTNWGRGHIWLLGDAAHATLPNEGQGAAMAIEDALALRLALQAPSLAQAHRDWVALRDARVRKIQRDSRWFGWVGQWENPLAVALRDRALHATPAAAAARQLRDVVAPGLALCARA